MSKKVKVISCSDNIWWYKNCIGEEFEVKDIPGIDYRVLGPHSVGSYLTKYDCIDALELKDDLNPLTNLLKQII